MKLKRCGAAIAAIAGLALAVPAAAQKAPESLIFSGFEVGTSTYSQVQAVGNAINAQHGTVVRTLPFGDAVGRLLAAKTGRVEPSSFVGAVASDKSTA